ncbi:23S rRNA (adenine(2030)-N(6))-methyltransferase RlmJ [Hyphomicrobium sp.]|jgi:23S rRNA (adenine2030-N6)-methyltransferase|uniref:23S rRNA (adenine(2030)-N(6))-methyltransferase RlmJ n=1 Tax=Hyphomicrobium sp. TaxID=82 RepID=UPI002C0C25C1|nr:23S rRNA (adenine(2030)-N(6))-methyltransferase RlmJ [Hyphomicrobium sp.]HVZ03850.1 23S rRNA (adenine(2030)-N(6))-methyltransferase RlmJ [Hyphomicrobium sp.]
MNYRHAYHAGNFADVVKHVILARVITYMKRKPQPFRVIDTHAGAGRYDLSGQEAQRTGEWRDGIGSIFGRDLPSPVSELLAPYLDAVGAVNAPNVLRVYPGSSLIARMIMRTDDVLVANELDRETFAQLKQVFARSKNTTILNIDARHAVKSLLPPKERRGVILIDPPFEEKSEFADLAIGVREAMERFSAGIYVIWYPLKDGKAAETFIAETAAVSDNKFLDVRLGTCAPFPGLGLTAAGVLILNPPYVLRNELEIVLPVLEEGMREGDGSFFDLRDGVQ